MDAKKREQLKTELKNAQEKLEEIKGMDVDSLSDDELEAVSGGGSGWCCDAAQ
ncbi:MAG: hypothetical protein AAGC60_04790 [Acidobacteriota bacterium]